MWFLDPLKMAEFIKYDLLNGMDKSTIRQWALCIALFVIGSIGWIKTEQRLK
jgi:hypothetical protein